MIKRIALFLVAVYQRYVRGFLPSSCRFSPTCSDYAKQALAKYGFAKGSLMAAKRIMLCHPFSCKSGYDPLP